MSPDMPCPSERKDRASFKEVPEIFSDVSRDQPIVKNLDCTALQRLWTTYEPITVRAFDRHVEQPYEPAVLCLMIMAGMHQRHPKPLRRRFEHQRAGIELVDRGRFQVRHKQSVVEGKRVTVRGELGG